MVTGTLLAESLQLDTVVEVARLRVRRISRRAVSDSASDQPSTWTFVEFEAEDTVAEPLAECLAGSLLRQGGWYADLTVGADHVVVFAGRVFRYRRGDQTGRAEAQAYGRSVGVPPHQLDWDD